MDTIDLNALTVIVTAMQRNLKRHNPDTLSIMPSAQRALQPGAVTCET